MITRSDISPGYQCVQSVHSLADFAHQHPHHFDEWKNDSNSIICLSVKSEKELQKFYYKFEHLTPTVKFFEPDVNEYTSLCLYGTPEVRRRLMHLPLIFQNESQKIKI